VADQFTVLSAVELSGVLAVGLLAVWVVFTAIAGPRKPNDLAAVDELLTTVAGLLHARFKPHKGVPLLSRPGYGVVEGEYADLKYVLGVLSRNAEDDPGCGRLFAYSVKGRVLHDQRAWKAFVTDEAEWHWPERTNPEVLAEFVRQHLAELAPD
jgi:hypothetical protein